MVTLTEIGKILQGNFDWQRDISLLTTDLLSLNFLFSRWGIYKAGGSQPAIEFDTVLSVEFKKDWSLLTYPVEKGAFETYNKVQLPYDCRVTFASGGSYNNRSALLRSVSAIAGDLKLYDIVTPEITLLNANVAHFDWRRAEGKAGLVQVTVWLTEIRSTVQSAFTNIGSTTGSDTGAGPAIEGDQGGANVDVNTNPSAATSESGGNVQGTQFDLGITQQDEIMYQFGMRPDQPGTGE